MSLIQQHKIPDLIAHRGNAAEYPENTLPALRSALELGARFVEFDIQLSADHQPVLLHDDNLRRTAGIDRNALEMNCDELAEVRVNEERRFDKRFTDIGIPTLAQAVSVLAFYPNATAFVELKEASLRAFGKTTVIDKVCEILEPVAAQCVLVSSDLAAIHCVRQKSSHRIGWFVHAYNNLSALKCEALCPDYVFCDHRSLSNPKVKLWRGPWRWAICEVSSHKLALDLAERGARLIETMAVRTMLREFRGLQFQSKKL